MIVDLLRAGLGQGLVIPHPGFPRSFAGACQISYTLSNVFHSPL